MSNYGCVCVCVCVWQQLVLTMFEVSRQMHHFLISSHKLKTATMSLAINSPIARETPIHTHTHIYQPTTTHTLWPRYYYCLLRRFQTSYVCFWPQVWNMFIRAGPHLPDDVCKCCHFHCLGICVLLLVLVLLFLWDFPLVVVFAF